MPRKPKRPCSHMDCPKLVDGRFCKKHEKEYNRNYEKYKRNPETYKSYDKIWRIIRKRYIEAHPLCERCLSEHKMTKADHTERKQPSFWMMQQLLKLENLKMLMVHIFGNHLLKMENHFKAVFSLYYLSMIISYNQFLIHYFFAQQKAEDIIPQP